MHRKNSENAEVGLGARGWNEGSAPSSSGLFLRAARARCRFLLEAASAKTFLSTPPTKRKGEVFTLRLPYSLQSAAKEERSEPRRHSASATSTDSCAGPLEPDTCIFPGEPISGIHASLPSV